MKFFPLEEEFSQREKNELSSDIFYNKLENRKEPLFLRLLNTRRGKKKKCDTFQPMKNVVLRFDRKEGFVPLIFN